MKNEKKGGEKLNMRVALLLILLVFAFAPMITALATTFIIPTINQISLARATAYDVVFEIQLMGDPVDSPFGPG